MPLLMPWWTPAVLALTYVAGTLILRLIPKSRVEDRPEQPRADANQHRQHAEHAHQRQYNDHGVAGGAAWVPAGLGSHGVERDDRSP